jgi:hypothetical protein
MVVKNVVSDVPGLDYRQARKRYAPSLIACQRCDTLIPPTYQLERIEQLCPTCFATCGLRLQANTARRRLVHLLVRRCRLCSNTSC